MAKTYKNDIFEVIKQIDNKNYEYYDSLTDEQKKEIQPYTLMRWVSTASGDEQTHELLTVLVNELLNNHYSNLYKYKDLQWKLLCVCGQKKFVKHQWISNCKSNIDKQYKTIKEYYKDLNEEDFNIKYKSLSNEDIEQIYQHLGLKDK